MEQKPVCLCGAPTTLRVGGRESNAELSQKGYGSGRIRRNPAGLRGGLLLICLAIKKDSKKGNLIVLFLLFLANTPHVRVPLRRAILITCRTRIKDGFSTAYSLVLGGFGQNCSPNNHPQARRRPKTLTITPLKGTYMSKIVI